MATRIDLHTHTSVGSACSRLEIRDLILTARERGLDAVCVTDHDTYAGWQIARKWGEELGFLVLCGVEIRSLEGDCLVFAQGEMDLGPVVGQTIQAVVDHAAAVGAVAVAAHPFRMGAPSLHDRLFDVAGLGALEGYNGNCRRSEIDRALEAAARLSLPVTGGSDAHHRDSVGVCYTEFDGEVSDQAGLLSALRSGAFRPRAVFEGGVE